MARLFQTGFELNSITAEWGSNTGITIVSGSPEILTTAARSGTYGLRVNNTSGVERVNYPFSTTNLTEVLYNKVYIKINALPTANTDIILGISTGAIKCGVRLKTDGKLQLWNIEDNVQVGSDSASALSTGVWYRIDFKVDTTTVSSTALEVRVGGVSVASGTANLASGINRFSCGTNGADATLDIEYDDWAINDATGSDENSWPNSNKIINLLPDATGDANGFLVQVGGTVGSTNNYTRVNEVTPNDATSYNASAVLNAEDLFNVGASGIGAGDTVHVVAIGARFANLVGADATTAFKLEVMKTSGGTKAQSAAIIPNSTSWQTNTSTDPRNYPLVTYRDPDGAAWTQATLDTMQVGYIITAANVQSIAVTKVWPSIDYTPAGVSPSASASPSSSLSPSSSASASLSPSSSVSASTSPSASLSPSASPSPSPADTSTLAAMGVG